MIEVMIVVAIVAILASVALPAYQSYVRRGHLQEGFSMMSGFQLKMEQHYQDNRGYQDTSSTSACPTALVNSLTSKYFTFSCALDTNQKYTLTATGTGSTAGYVYTINQANARKTTSFAGTAQSPALNCWADRSATC